MIDQWRLGADLKEVGRVVAELQARMAPVLGSGAHDIALAVEELLANAVIHGCKLGGREPNLFLECFCEVGSVRVEVRDDGPPFNPLEAPLPDLELALDERPLGGLGVHLVRTLIDRAVYERQGNENVVVLSHGVGDEGPPVVRGRRP